MTVSAPYDIVGSDTGEAAFLTKCDGNFTDIYNKLVHNIITTKGDLIVATADDTIARHAVGTDDYVLTADSGETNGMKWAALKESICIVAFATDQTVATGDGTISFVVPAELNGMNLTAATAGVYTAGTVGNTTDVQIRRRRAGASADMLSTKITLSVDEYHASDGVIDTDNDDIATGDMIMVDVDAVNDTAPEGLAVTMTFNK
jgi:hypothetical protein